MKNDLTKKIHIMGRKVFISFLGNTRYQETVYMTPDGKSATPTPFIQEVLFDYICEDWSMNDKIYIICTEGEKGSLKTNWLGENGYVSLQKKLERKSYFDITKPITLKEGTEKDLWSLFDIIYKLIEDDGDEIYLDVTNAFRSFPTLATTLLAYAKFMNNAKVGKIYYGIYDRDAEKNPIVDLSPIVQLQECVDMASGLRKYGRFDSLADGLMQIANFEDIAPALKELDKALSSNIGDYIRNAEFKTIIEQNNKRIKGAELPAPTKSILLEVLKRISNFRTNANVENLLAASRWANEHMMLPQAYAFGKEYINRTAELKLRKWNPYHGKDAKKDYLEYLNKIMSIENEIIDNRAFKDELKKHSILTEKIINLPWIREIRKYYVSFNYHRNGIAHIKPDFTYENFYECYKSCFEECVKIVRSAETVQKEEDREAPHIFINLSNHPSSKWSDAQLNAAREYGEIIDIPFPKVDDFGSEDDILKLVDRFCKDILLETHRRTQNVVVHIMGEMTFTYAMVKELNLMGITCVASTTERITEELPDGSKNVKFEFCRFRRYE